MQTQGEENQVEKEGEGSGGRRASPRTPNRPPAPQLIYTQDELEQDISNLHFHAWRFRGSEHHLYPLYNLILTVACLNFRHLKKPTVSLVCAPQALFGKIPPAGTLNKELPKLTAAEKKEKKKKDNEEKKTHPAQQLPDFARLIIFSDDADHPHGSGLTADPEIADFYELKTLNCEEPWWTVEAKGAASSLFKGHLEQVYDAVIAAFAYNPKWLKVYATLVIGGYFTQMVWTERPEDNVLTPIIKTSVPRVVKKGVDYRHIIGKLLNEVPKYESRVMPSVLFYNEPAFTYHGHETNVDCRPVSLSPSFLNALSSPIKRRFAQLSARSPLFLEPPSRKPQIRLGVKSTADILLKEKLKEDPMSDLHEKARSLGHRFPGDPEPTPTPPNSTAEERFKGSVKNIKDLPRRHIQTRLQSFVGPEEDEDGELDADDNADGEPETGATE